MSYTDFDFPHSHFYDDDLRELISMYKTLTEDVEVLNAWKETHQEEYEQLEQLYNDIVTGDFPASMKSALKQWFDDNAISLVGEMIKHVYFGLNDDGYFIVTIPESWKELVFKTTGWDYNTPLQPEYGHLCLLY